MPQQKKQQFDWKKFLSDRSQAISSGILALILIILAFLALDTLSQTSKSTNENKNEEKREQTLSDNDTKDAGKKVTQENKNEPTTTNYTVQPGDNLWKIAVKIYNDGYKWTQIANENSIANPDKIEKGQILRISNTATVDTSKSEAKSDQELKITYQVQKGDSLWSISQKFYSGNGYHWVLIRDANLDKVSLLANGRPRIEPGTILTIPQLK